MDEVSHHLVRVERLPEPQQVLTVGHGRLDDADAVDLGGAFVVVTRPRDQPGRPHHEVIETRDRQTERLPGLVVGGLFNEAG